MLGSCCKGLNINSTISINTMLLQYTSLRNSNVQCTCLTRCVPPPATSVTRHRVLLSTYGLLARNARIIDFRHLHHTSARIVLCDHHFFLYISLTRWLCWGSSNQLNYGMSKSDLLTASKQRASLDSTGNEGEAIYLKCRVGGLQVSK